MQPPRHDPGERAATAVYHQIAQNPAKAWSEARRALKTFPQSERVAFVAGLVCLTRGQKRDARKYFAKAINLGTPTPDAYVNFAQISAEEGLTDSALTALEKAQARFSGDLSLWRARVNVHRMAGDSDLALKAVEDALEDLPGNAELQELRGVLLADCGRLLDAIHALETLLEANPNRPIALINLGRFYAFTNQAAKSLEVTERAYSMAPNLPAVIDNLANRKRENGDFETAASLFRQLADTAPDFVPEALRQLAELAPETALETLSKEVARAARKAPNPEAGALLGFAQAAIAKRTGNASVFVSALKDANRKMSRLRRYDEKADTEFHQYLRARFAEEPAVALDTPSLPARPLFILGLPRSGTTLLERMLSAGQGIAGLGEVAAPHRYFSARFMAGEPISDGLPGLRQRYADLAALAGPADWTIDKMPVNYMHIGWLTRAFPEAQIILLRRDFRAVALSMFENFFDDPGQAFTFLEKAIQHRLALFEDTIADWQSLGVPFQTVHYEDLVSAPEATLNTLCADTGLPFDPAMLRPEDNRDSIRTVSSLQARESINTKSVARWESYPDLLPNIFKH
ncbi:tetratricopeptide repeat-containing sulfotransferase family protein [Shimia aestuarii]|uniref:Tetratricopeptide repeat-containing protein n=1 Tax=Shimia aestuarii TaxID=254406 RepID=A0A1I4I3E5_9RHOB|nr:tetratricopeptide repeat-containing sulfotransferase family protein [Shimia aestuarii]SFL48710.1 Tetratricopeptide repeat-containing protein [Shimia aestuarii]